MLQYRRLSGYLAAIVPAVVLMVAGSRDAWAASDTTCTSGPIASGVYANVHVTGACTIANGSVTVLQNLTVDPSASLVAATGGPLGIGASSLTVGGNIDVQKNGVLVLGCEPVSYICLNDPDQTVGSYSTVDAVAGNLTAENALAVVVHRTSVGGSVSLIGGGGGISSCGESLPVLAGSPPYGDFEDNVIGGSLTMRGWNSCWLGWLRNIVIHNVEFNDNQTGDPDGNEMGTNTVFGNLNCNGNNPVPQFGDSGAVATTVLGSINGQCAPPLVGR